MFQNGIRLDAKISELKTKYKGKNTTEKTAIEIESSGTVNSSEEKKNPKLTGENCEGS